MFRDHVVYAKISTSVLRDRASNVSISTVSDPVNNVFGREQQGDSHIGSPSSLLTDMPISDRLVVKAANLDALRAVAVLLVLVDHVLGTISVKHPSFTIHPYDWALGRLGVLLFFVHTSLVLNYSMTRLRLTGWALVRSFLVRRAFRIYPLSIVCVLTVVMLRIPDVPWHDEWVWNGWPNLASNLALTTNLTFSAPVLGPLWSLPIEVQMYLTLPLIFLVCMRGHRRIHIVFCLWLCSLLVAHVQPAVSDRLSVFGFAPYFIAGVLSFTLTCDGRDRGRISAVFWIPSLLALVCVYLVVQSFAGGIYSKPLQWAFCLVVALMIPLFRDSTAILLNQMTHLVAKYSYGIYLFHCIALSIACGTASRFPEAVQWVLALALLVVASVASFHFFEKPAIDYGGYLAAKFTAKHGYPVESKTAVVPTRG